MLFQIKRVADGKVVMWTENEDFIYDAEIIKEMNRAGYMAYLDGKIYRPGRKNKKEEV
ncbi:MAG: hypothetical protein LUB59_03655 [Candidatus Gastranaerophilales bacterium]|nr:hypothetical protein [Candidatus Gastranaerophilales bacterium]